jgi:BirA family biotin operon repressor/biotin-[acetyl-CoA-carboxylase] ligase
LDQVKLKWPNDLRIGRAKLGGILIEQRGEAGGPCRLVIGVGINVAMQADQAGTVDQLWTTVNNERFRAGKDAISRNVLAATLLESLIAALAEFEIGGFAAFISDWNALDVAANQPVRILGIEPPLAGIARGIDANGALIVEADGHRHHLHAGEVSLRLEEGGV